MGALTDNPVKCATMPGLGNEFTVCGDAFDAHESGDSERPIVFAKRFETVTCPNCLAILKELRQSYKVNGYRMH